MIRRLTVFAASVLAIAVATAALFLSGALTSRAVQDPTISLDMDPTGNTYNDATNSMTIGTIESCHEGAGTATHGHPTHLIIRNVEDLVGWQVRFNYDGGKMRPQNANFAPFSDNNTGQNISFNNLPLEGGIHRDLITASTIPPANPGPQTALIGATYNGTQNFAVSPDTPAKSTPDDTSYSAPGGGVLASVVLQVIGDQTGNLLTMDLDDGDPNAPGSRTVVFNGTGTTDIDLTEGALGDGQHAEGTTCGGATATPTATPTDVATPTPTETAVATPTPTETGVATPTPTETGVGTPTPTATPTEVATPTPTETGVVTPTPTPTETGVVTPTPTPTEVATATPTPTPTETTPGGETCDGQAATKVGTGESELILGTSGADVIVGGDGNDIIVGFSGDDVICGGGGRDLIVAGNGNDRAFGDSGNDLVLGGAGDDDLSGGEGDDRCVGATGADTFDGCEFKPGES